MCYLLYGKGARVKSLWPAVWYSPNNVTHELVFTQLEEGSEILFTNKCKHCGEHFPPMIPNGYTKHLEYCATTAMNKVLE